MSFSLTTFLAVLKVIAAPILAAAGVPQTLIPLAQHSIAIAERVKSGAPGAEKKVFALDVIRTTANALIAIKPGLDDHINTEALVNAASDGIDATVAAVNALKSTLPH